MASRRKGFLIAVEGIDGAGKTTLVRALGEALALEGYDVTLTREPTDGPFGRKIRELAKKGRDEMSPAEELDLFIRDRKEHVEKVILPALRQGKVVLTDRYYFSSIAYQSVKGLDPVEILSANVSFAPKPDLVILLDITPDEGLKRILSGRNEPLTLFEKKESLRKVREVFNSLADDTFLRLDAKKGSQELLKDALAAVAGKLKPA